MKMREIPLHQAKATLSAIVDNAARGQACVITRHGKAEAVLVGYNQWKWLSQVPSFGRLLMAAPADVIRLRGAMSPRASRRLRADTAKIRPSWR